MAMHPNNYIFITIKYKDENNNFVNECKTYLTQNNYTELDKYTSGDYEYISYEIHNQHSASCEMLEKFLDDAMNQITDKSVQYLLRIFDTDSDKKHRRIHINKKGKKIITKSTTKYMAL